MTDLNKQLRDIRPPLRIAAPLTFYVTLGYAVFNIVLGSLLFKTDLSHLLTFVGLINATIWACIFLAYGLTMAAILKYNNWSVTRRFILVGITIKTMWLLELLVEALAGRGFVLVFIWSLLLYLQIISYIYFTPVKQHVK